MGVMPYSSTWRSNLKLYVHMFIYHTLIIWQLQQEFYKTVESGDSTDRGLNWMQLMSTLSSLTTVLNPANVQGGSQNTSESLAQMWEIMQTSFVNNILHRYIFFMAWSGVNLMMLSKLK